MSWSNLPTQRSKPPTWSNVPTFKVECAHIVQVLVFNSFLDCLNVGGIE